MTVTTITPSTYLTPLSEKDILSFQPESPVLKMGTQSFPPKKSGTIPYDPDCLHIVDTEEFRHRFTKNKGSADVVPDALPPIDWRNPLCSEDDNRCDLKNKVYLPLSRALQASYGMAFSRDCMGHRDQDTSVVALDDMET